MLFMAITLGFFVENQREEYVERKQEREYILSMVEDLEKDTANLADVLNQYQRTNLKMDTAIRLFPAITKEFNDTLWRILLKTRGFPDFIYTDRTMQQLKNSGAMQLIRNKKAANGIMDYDAKVKDHEIDVTSFAEVLMQYDRIWNEVVDQNALNRDLKTMSLAEMKSLKRDYLLLHDRPSVGKFNNMLFEFQSISLGVQKQEIQLKEKAIQLLALLKKEYSLP